MSDVIISKVNEVYVKIQAEKHIIREMSEYFTFMVPGHQFTPAFRNRVWDGKIRLLDLRNNQIYHGLLKYIEEFFTDRGYTYEYDDTRADLEDEHSVYHAKKFFESLNKILIPFLSRSSQSFELNLNVKHFHFFNGMIIPWLSWPLSWQSSFF